MREILFRGKLISGKGWSYGNLVVNTQGVTIITPDKSLIGKYGQVDPKTVGQYTGLTDKNGTRIFEGDILEGYLDDAYPENATTVAVIWYKNGWCILQEECDPDPLEDTDSQHFCVIGNIYDNPELLEGKK